MLPFVIVFIFMLSLCCYGVVGYYFSVFININSKWKLRLIKIAVSLVLGIVCYYVRVFALAMMYLLVILGLVKLIEVILKRVLKRFNFSNKYKVSKWIYRSGLVPILVIVIVFLAGHFNINRVVNTQYTVRSGELNQNYRVVFISDTHYGTIQTESVLMEKVQEINTLNSDIVILGGDIVEEGTSKQKMQECFEVLGGLKSRYGMFYVYGNHDRQRYSNSPSYTEDELKTAIESNDIKILKEEVININGDLVLVGREDVGSKCDRIESLELKSKIDANRFVLVADHQPNDIESNSEIGADLQISGHTHGGQIFPLGWMTFFYRGFVYGNYEQKNTTVLVSSGFAGWGFPIRTQGVSEYVTVDLLKK